jgi:GNAT superfamily N-acetyltransferase
MTSDSNDVVVRPFRPQDQAVARALILAGLVEHWGTLDPTKNPDLDDIAQSYADATFLLVWQRGELVGTGALIPETPGVGRIVRMSVATHKRRRGLGSLILQQLIEHARAIGYHRLVLETTSTWLDVIAFYQRHGFRSVEERDGDTHFVLDLSPSDQE